MTDTTGPLVPERPLRVTRTKSLGRGVIRPAQPMHTVGSITAYATDARPLTLLDRAVLPAARGLVADIQCQIEATETRGNQRRVSGQQKLRVALGAIVGGLLVSWLCRDALVRRVLTKDAFTGEEVGYAATIAALDTLEHLGLIRRIKGNRCELPTSRPGLFCWRLEPLIWVR